MKDNFYAEQWARECDAWDEWSRLLAEIRYLRFTGQL